MDRAKYRVMHLLEAVGWRFLFQHNNNHKHHFTITLTFCVDLSLKFPVDKVCPDKMWKKVVYQYFSIVVKQIRVQPLNKLFQEYSFFFKMIRLSMPVLLLAWKEWYCASVWISFNFVSACLCYVSTESLSLCMSLRGCPLLRCRHFW